MAVISSSAIFSLPKNKSPALAGLFNGPKGSKLYRYSRDTYSPYCVLDPILSGEAEIPTYQV